VISGRRISLAVALGLLGAQGCSGRLEDGAGGAATSPPPGKATAPAGSAPTPGTPSGGSMTATGMPAPIAIAPPAAACRAGKPPSPRIWRLSASQYNNTMATVVPAAGAPADRFPRISSNSIFQDQAGVLSLPTPFVGEVFSTTRTLAAAARTAHARSYPCLAATAPDPACMKTFLREFGLRAFRRPLEAAEVDDYHALFVGWQAKRGTVAAAEDLYRVLLGSPFFLFRTELGGAGASGTRTDLTAFERASALSYLLVDGPPDEELLRAAAQGQLASKPQVEAQARRLLGGVDSSRFVRRFFGQYFAVDNVVQQPKSPRLFPQFTMQHALDMQTESLLFVEQVLRREGGRWGSLLTADFSMINDRLAAIYGAPGVQGAQFRKVTLPPNQRSGLLTQGSFLAAEATDEETDIVHRGLYVRERLLCADVPPPPANVPPVPAADRSKTMRDRLAAHTADPACAACHRGIDTYGYAFELYDAIGRYRTMENGRAIDAKGAIVNAGASDGPYDGAIDLSRKLAAAPAAGQCFVRQLVRYAQGRPESADDACLLSTVAGAFERGGGDIAGAVLALTTTDEFLVRTLP
jgi:hypothetical protein